MLRNATCRLLPLFQAPLNTEPDNTRMDYDNNASRPISAPCDTPRRNLRIANYLAIAVCVAAPLANAANLTDLYESALANDPVLGAATASYEASRQFVPQARSALLPTLSATGDSSYTKRSFPGAIDPRTGVQIPVEEFNDHGWQAQLRQPMINLSSWYTLGSAKSNVRAAESDLASTAQFLIVRVVNAYLNVLRAQDLLDSTLAEETAVKRQLEQVQQRFDVGLVAITDVLESQAVFDNSVVRRIQADGDHDIFFESLRTLTAENYDTLDRLSETLPIVNPEPLAEEEWVTTALASNLGIKSAQERLQAANRTNRARRAEHLPTLDASVVRARSVTGSANFFNAEITDLTIYGVTLTVPVYQGGFTTARARESRAQAEQARQLLLDQQLTVGRDTRNLFRAVATDVVRVRARLKAIKSAESALEATETGYEVGTRNIVDVLQAQQRLFASQFDYADSRYNYVNNLMLLKQTTGTLTRADLDELNGFTDPNSQVKRLASLRNRSGDFTTQ